MVIRLASYGQSLNPSPTIQTAHGFELWVHLYDVVAGEVVAPRASAHLELS